MTGTLRTRGGREVGEGWASVGLAENMLNASIFVLREMETHERVLTIKGHDQIHIPKRSLCFLQGRVRIGRGQSGERETK